MGMSQIDIDSKELLEQILIELKKLNNTNKQPLKPKLQPRKQ